MIRNPKSKNFQNICIDFFDIAFAVVLLTLLVPGFIIIGIVIKLDSRGKIFFSQARVGKNGEIFKMIKFRTMYDDGKRSAVHYRSDERGEAEPVIKVRNDVRVTRVGKFLRKFSLDELPQLFNVLKGNMSLVGPRPPVLVEMKMYNAYQKKRLKGKPGLTGLAQISGRTDLNFNTIVKLDIEYLQNRSVWLYLKILILTLPYIIMGKSSY
jgi:lipopolysaccharide/colanic/teichoic acid biosynthesis glycosyltransferase